MKKSCLFLLAACLSILTHADETGLFHFDLSQENIPHEKATDYFNEWFTLDSNCTFEQVRDYTDKLGIRHTNYQQYYNGIEVEHCIIMIHSRDGQLTHANGCVMETENQPKATTKRISKEEAAKKVYPQSTGKQNAELLIISISTDHGTLFRPAYKIYDITKNADIYVDAETGEIIKTISHIYNADVTCRGYSLYNGWQNFTCDYSNTTGYYTLTDNARQIITIDATQANSDYLYQAITDYENETDEDKKYTILNQGFMNFMGTCRAIGNTTTTWSITTLASVTITSTPDNSWWYSIVDTKPDLYIKIRDAENNLVYISGTQEDCTLPVTFNIGNSIPLETTNYVIEIWDADMDDDDYGGSITLTSNEAGTYTWSGDYTTGRLTIENIGNPYIDAHWGMQKTYDFYKNVFDRKSYDDKNAAIIQFVFPPYDTRFFNSMPNNAFANAYYKQITYGAWPDFMAYGCGDGISMNPVVALDVMAHEFTHLVTAYNGNGGLVYQGESGALNESFSDIMGFAVENYVLGDNDYLIGEDVIIGYSNIRSMKDPNLGRDGTSPSPDTYGGAHWINPNDTANDDGGVHTNSGVQNKWFYLLCEGGRGMNDNGINYDVTGIGIEKGRQIAYRNLINQLSPTANFAAARQGSLDAATELYGKGSLEYQSVMNAWHAVGVGSKYILPDLPAPGKYVIVTQRDPSSNYFYMTSDLGTASTKRYQAVDAGTTVLSSIVAKSLDNKYIWEVIHSGNGIKLKNGTQYSTWKSGNSAILDNSGKQLNVINNNDGSYTLTFPESATVTRYLSLNADPKYNFFAYYGNTNQIANLTFIPYQTTATMTNIIEESHEIAVFASQKTIHIKSKEILPVSIFDMYGRRIYTSDDKSYMEVLVPQTGIYIVQIGKEARKIIVTN